MADTLFVMEGATVPVTNSSLYVNDIDTEFDGSSSDGHVFTLIKSPREGKLHWKNGTTVVVGTSFSMQVFAGFSVSI